MMMMRVFVVGVVLVSAAFVVAQEGRTWLPPPFVLPPFNRTQTTVMGVAGQQSRVIAIGNGRSPIGIYVYDRNGQCVAFDDEPTASVDDRIASWVPAETGPFDVQIRNAGPVFNRIDAAAK